MDVELKKKEWCSFEIEMIDEIKWTIIPAISALVTSFFSTSLYAVANELSFYFEIKEEKEKEEKEEEEDEEEEEEERK